MKLLTIVSVTLSLLSIVNAAPIDLTKRRFGVEHTPEADAQFQAMKDIASGTTFEAVLGDLSGAAVRALLARAPKCEQQDVADQCVDIAKQMGKQGLTEKRDQLIKVCRTYRTLERNTPNAGQASELCDKAPKNKELKGLVQRQDPTKPNDPNPPASNPPASNPPASNPPESNPPESNPPASSLVPDGTFDNEAFNNPVGGVQMPLILRLPEGSGAAFQVNGNNFQQIGAAQNRQCDIQHNLCFNKFNAGDRTFQGSDCDNQNNVCKAGEPVFGKPE